MAQGDAKVVAGEHGLLSPGLETRLHDIDGVASVSVDLTESGGGISVRLEPEADEPVVMEKIRALLVAYGVRSPNPPKLRRDRPAVHIDDVPLGVDVTITPIKGGARVQVEGTSVRSFRVVASNPAAIAQGLSDAWCQVVGKIPVEITSISISDEGQLMIVATDGDKESVGTGDVRTGWEKALARAVGRALGLVDDPLITSVAIHT